MWRMRFLEMDTYLQIKLQELSWAKANNKPTLVAVLQNCINKYYEQFGKPQTQQLKLWH